MVRFWEYWRGRWQGVLIGWIVIGMGLGPSVLMWASCLAPVVIPVCSLSDGSKGVY